MDRLICPACGGELIPDSTMLRGKCAYCGGEHYFSAEELGVVKAAPGLLAEMFRGESVSTFLKRRLRDAELDEIFSARGDAITLTGPDSQIQIRHLHGGVQPGALCFMGRHTVVLVFDSQREGRRFADTAKGLCYPDERQGYLRSLMPRVRTELPLHGGRMLVALERGRDEYPLASFSELESAHGAWIMSRLQNICCLLQFNGLAIPDLQATDFYMDPYEHQLFLCGGLGRAVAADRASLGLELKAVRRIVRELMGSRAEEAPEDFRRFLEEAPRADAYSDFSKWDLTLTLAFGGRRFQELDPGTSTVGRELNR